MFTARVKYDILEPIDLTFLVKTHGNSSLWQSVGRDGLMNVEYTKILVYVFKTKDIVYVDVH